MPPCPRMQRPSSRSHGFVWAAGRDMLVRLRGRLVAVVWAGVVGCSARDTTHFVLTDTDTPDSTDIDRGPTGEQPAEPSPPDASGGGSTGSGGGANPTDPDRG